MKKLIISYILFILLATPIVLADSVTVEVSISESLYVTFNYTTNIPELYEEIKTQGFDASTIPNVIEEKFEQQDLTNARVIYDLNQKVFNDTTSSIHVELLLTGSDIVSYTLNATDSTRTFQARTDWRKIQVSLSQNFSLNFEESFGAPLTEWQQVNGNAFEKIVENPQMSFRFVLPENALEVHAEGDTIIFKVPTTFEDTLLNSPFLILGAIFIAIMIVGVYRKARK